MRCFVLVAPAVYALALSAALPSGATAQQTPAEVGSTVSGRVVCADTNAPARFAKVLLKSTAPDHTGEDFMKGLQANMEKASAKSGQPAAKPMTEEKKQALAAASRGMNRATDMLNSSTVGLDGGYSFAGVKAGTYYVHALFAGYIDPFSQFSDEDFASTDPAMRARIAQTPTITVTGTDAAHADLRLDRGAAVSGRIVYGDGSPAAGWTLSVIKPKSLEDAGEATMAAMNQALAMSGGAQIYKTDDLGRYRMSGLAAGDYALRANLVATAIGVSAANLTQGGSGINLAIYSGGTFSRADARPFHVTAGEERSGVDITIPEHSLHTLGGHVVAKGDGHTLNSGQVLLTSKENAAMHLRAAIRDDGSFRFDYLPGGASYTATVEDAGDATSSGPAGNIMGMSIPNTEILHKYGIDSAEVALGDADVESVKLTVAQTDWTPLSKKPGAPNIGLGDMFNGLLGGDSKDTK